MLGITCPNRRRWLAYGLVMGVFVLLIGGLTACQTLAQTPTTALPHRLALIDDPDHFWENPDMIAVSPNGYAYVNLLLGGIAVLNGPRLVKVIRTPGLNETYRQVSGGLAADPHTGYVYWTDDFGSLHVISGTTVITSMTGLDYLPDAVAVHPTTGLIYVANTRPKAHPFENQYPGIITVISQTAIIAKLNVGYAPARLAINPVDQQVYVGQFTGFTMNHQPLTGMLGIISGTTVVTNTSLGIGYEGAHIEKLAIDQTNGDLYFIQGLAPLFYWDRKHPPVKVPFDFDKYGHGRWNDVAVDSQHHLAYATYMGSSARAIFVIDKGKVLAELPVARGEPRTVAVDTAHDYVYVANYLDARLIVLRGTEVITALDTIGAGPWDIGIDEQRGYIYVSNTDGHTITVFGFNQSTAAPTFWQTYLPWLKR